MVHNNITGNGDNLLFSPIFSRKGWGIVTRYELPVGSYGTRLFTEYTHVSASPTGAGFGSYDYSGQVNVFTPGVLQILYDNHNMRVSTDLAFNIMQSDGNAFNDTVDVERKQIRSLRYGVQLDRDDSSGNTSLRNEVGWGLDVFGGTTNASEKLSNPGGGTNFIRYTASLARAQNLPWGTQGLFQAIINLTPNSMNSFDQWGPGGTFLGRGYRESYVGGDSALLLTSEWRTPFFFFPKSWKFPKSEDAWRDRINMVFFLDYSQTHLNNQEGDDIDPTEQFLGTGAGLRINFSKYLTGRIDLAFPILRPTPFSQEPRIHFGLQSAII